MGWTPPEHSGVRDVLNFDCDDEIRAGCVIASLLLNHQEVYVRHTRRGYHVVVDDEPDLVKRWMLGDCFGRLHADMKRKRIKWPTGILFYFKNGRFVSKWVRVRAIKEAWLEVWPEMEYLHTHFAGVRSA